MTRTRFRPSYGAMSPETASAVADLVGVAVQAGTSVATTAIQVKSQKKLAAAQRAHAKKMAQLEAKRAALEARAAEATARTAKPPTPAAPAAAAVPGWAIGLGVAVLLGAGGFLYYKSTKSEKKSTAEPEKAPRLEAPIESQEA